MTITFKPITLRDKDGNIYNITINGKCYITLKDGKRRWIGDIDRYNKTFKKDKRNTYIFKKTAEFGFPYELLSYLIENEWIDTIEITLGNVQYTLPVDKDTLKEANFRYFKKKGYEKQVFIPISKFNVEKI